MISDSTRGQLVRYALIGLSSNLLLYAAYLALTATGRGHKTTMTLLYVCGLLFTFIVNRSWSFAHKGRFDVAFARYVITYLFGYVLNWAMLWIGADNLQFPHQFVQAIAIASVAACVFLLQKFWVFAPTSRETIT